MININHTVLVHLFRNATVGVWSVTGERTVPSDKESALPWSDDEVIHIVIMIVKAQEHDRIFCIVL